MLTEIDSPPSAPRDPWSLLDELVGVGAANPQVDGAVGPMAAYGRCSTEDNQDPRTSRGWQFGNAERFVGPLGGTIVAEFFDIGQSRSVTWDRRTEAARLLAALKDPARGWNAIVVGEGTRCWFGNQFSLVAPLFAAYGVDLWIPELGGKYDPRNPSHKMLMSILGGMSESERQHVQARVRAAMDAQVINEGRHQGGRAPHGYTVADDGPHPNPRKAAEGFRRRVLVIDEDTAQDVRRIFRDYLDGAGDRAIAARLNRDGRPCPSRNRPEQNSHRLADGWQGSTVRAILENPRYTGYAVFGRWTRHEVLADPENVSAGHVTRFQRADPDHVVRSRAPAHPAIVSIEDYTRAQLLRRSRATGGMSGIAKLDRSRSTTPKHLYLLRGRVRCAACERKMQGGVVSSRVYYRCKARTLAPGAAALADHPATVNLRETHLSGAINTWLGRLFAPDARDDTVRALVASQGDPAGLAADSTARRRLAEAETTLKRFQDAIAAGVDPSAVVEAINAARADRDATRAQLSQGRAPRDVYDLAEVYAMVDALGDVGVALAGARPERLARLYEDLDVAVRFQPTDDGGVATLTIRVANECVRGGT